MEIAPGVHLIPGVVGGRPLQLTLLRGEWRTVLLDTGCAGDPERFIFPYLREIGVGPEAVDLVINTHADLDHCGGNADLKRVNPRVLLSCGEADRALIEDPAVMWARRYNRYAARHGIAYDGATRDWIMAALGEPQPVDFTWTGGERLRLGPNWLVEVQHAPGHTAGHLILYDRARRLVLTGDAAHGAVYLDTEGRPALCPTYVHVDTYLGTLRCLHGLGAETLLGCHWPVKRGAEVDAFLDESAQFVALAEDVLRAALAAQPEGVTLRELIAAAGPRLGAWPRAVDGELVYALAGHMERMEALGTVTVEESGGLARYRPA